jgi:Microtubule binding
LNKIAEMEEKLQSIQEEKQIIQKEYSSTCEYIFDLNKVIQDLKGTMRVYCRLRPNFSQEKSPLEIVNDKCISLVSSKSVSKYLYDKIFNQNCC